jgi:hypothetical protein
MAPITDYQVTGTNNAALFTLKLHRGEGMTLIAMNWKNGKPTDDFVGFAIEYQEPGGKQFYPLKNRLGFLGNDSTVNPNALSTRLSPIQKFRWVHFPRNADMPGMFIYRVTPVFMNTLGELSYGDFQQAALQLMDQTYPNELNVAFTRGFVSSQAFVDKYATAAGNITTLLPALAKDGLNFTATDPQASTAYEWMGFEARSMILSILDNAVTDTKANVYVIGYDFNEPEVVSRLQNIGPRLQVIIDNSGSHKTTGSAENQAADLLSASAGAANVKRQHMGALQHNKIIIVDSPTQQVVVCGSTNLSWRGFYVQNNNAIAMYSAAQVTLFKAAFNQYWESDAVADFGNSAPALLNDLKLDNVEASIAFSPHSAGNALLQNIATDISETTSSLFYSLAFLYETKGALLDAINEVTNNPDLFVYGISDKKVGGIDLKLPGTNPVPVYPTALSGNLPEPFKSEPVGGSGTRMHHKFVVIDFNLPTARVYMGSYNFSNQADTENGENLLLIKDAKIATSYMIQAVIIFDHYEFRVAQLNAATALKTLYLHKPPQNPGDVAWWEEDYTDNIKIRDRELFA